MAYKDQSTITVPGNVKEVVVELARAVGMTQPATLLALVEHGREGLIAQRRKQLDGAMKERREHAGQSQ